MRKDGIQKDEGGQELSARVQEETAVRDGLVSGGFQVTARKMGAPTGQNYDKVAMFLEQVEEPEGR